MGHFFPTLPGCVRACLDGLGRFLSTFAGLTEGGGLKQCPYRTNTFQKGASLTMAMMMIVKVLKVLTKAIRNYYGDSDDDCEKTDEDSQRLLWW